MTHSIVLLRGNDFTGNLVEVVKHVHANPLPGLGTETFSVDTPNASTGFATYRDASRFLTGHGFVNFDVVDRFGQPTTEIRTGLGLPIVLFAEVNPVPRDPEPVEDHSPTTTADPAPTATDN